MIRNISEQEKSSMILELSIENNVLLRSFITNLARIQAHLDIKIDDLEESEKQKMKSKLFEMSSTISDENREFRTLFTPKIEQGLKDVFQE